MADLSSILGGMIQGFKDFGTGLVDMFGTGGAAIGDLFQSGGRSTKNQDDFRKWLYQTDNKQDAAAKGLGTILNGVQTVADVIPGAQAITANPLFNGLQGAVAGVSDELKMAGKDADWGRAAQRAGVGGASGLLSAAAGQNLQKSGSKLLNNGLTRGAVQGAIGGGIANAGYTGIEGGSVQDMINAGLYGARTGALVGGTTGLARELIKPAHKMDVALTDDERRARIANIDDQLAKLDTSTQEGIDRHNELMTARIKYEQPQEYMMAHRPTRSGIYADDLLAEGEDGLSYPKDVYDKPQNYTFMYTDTPDVMNETMAQLNAVRGNPNGEVTIYRATPGDTINDGDWITLSESYAKLHNDTQLDGKGNVLSQKVNVRDIQPAMDDLAEWGYFPQKKAPTNVADLMNEPKQKTVADLMLSPDDDVMYSKVAEGQLGLFDQPMPKPEPEPVALPKSLGEQASLFDQPKQPIVEAQVVDTEPVNPYAPVDGQVTQKMRDRAADVIKNYAKGVPENELFNAIDERTLPKGYKEFRELVDNSKSFAKERIGAESVKKADLKKVVEYLYPDTEKQEEMLRNVKIEESNDAARRAMYGLKPRKSGTSFNEKILRNAASEKLAKEYAEKIRLVDDRVPELVNSLERWYSPTDLSVRTGLTAAADEVLSERLGIAPGNTIKYNGPADVRNAYGRYSKTAKNLALTKSNVADPEQAVSTIAHERLHSFQNEADLNRGKYGATNRYDKRVTDAFDDLRKDLEEAKVYKSYPETAERYGSKDAEYFYNTKEQEARMLQQYLNNKGYADLAGLKRPNTGKSRSGEFGTEVNAAFDKFFDKLRALSKKGVALPALTALFGGGAIMAATQNSDKKKKSEVK